MDTITLYVAVQDSQSSDVSEAAHYMPWIGGSVGFILVLVILARRDKLDLNPVIKAVGTILTTVFAKPIEAAIEMARNAHRERLRHRANRHDLEIEAQRVAKPTIEGQPVETAAPTEPDDPSPPDGPPPHAGGSAHVIRLEDYKSRRAESTDEDQPGISGPSSA
jgi:hypothetical protein